MKHANRWMFAGLLAAMLAAGYFWWQGRSSVEPAAPAASTPLRVDAAAVPAPVEPAPPVRLQLDAGPPAEPLPGLDASDATFSAILAGWFGQETWQALFRPERLIRHIVATVDNLPRRDAPVGTWPLRPAPGWLVTRERDGALFLAPGNSRRYAGHVAWIERLDASRAVAVYLRFYPLFQQAYEELGFPGAYFNDRLRVAIDDLLATPEPAEPPGLAPANVRYRFADADLDRRSAGQKILLRIGADNARIVKAKLREVRQALARYEQPVTDGAKK